jgi:hypothetical protein
VSYLYAVQFVDGSKTVATSDRQRMVDALSIYKDPNHPEDPPRYGAHIVRQSWTSEGWERVDDNGFPFEATVDSTQQDVAEAPEVVDGDPYDEEASEG